MPYFRFNDIEIHYEQRGIGDYPIILLHGLGASLESWFDIAPYLSKYQLYLLDLKGFGLSSAPDAPEYSIYDHPPYVLAFIRHLGASRCGLIGHSYGGIVATLVLLQAKALHVNVSTTILIDAPVIPAQFPLFVRALQVPVLRRLLVSWLPPSLQSILTLLQLGHSAAFASKERVKRYAKYFAQKGTQNALIRTAHSLEGDRASNLKVSPELAFADVLVIWGADDPIFPPSIGLQVSSLLPGSRFEAIPNCGHIPQEERPKETAMVVSAFIDEMREINELTSRYIL